MKHVVDINDKDLATIAGVINGFTVTVEALRAQVESLSRSKFSLKAKVFGIKVLHIEATLKEGS